MLLYNYPNHQLARGTLLIYIIYICKLAVSLVTVDTKEGPQ